MGSIPLVAMESGQWQAPATPLQEYMRAAQLKSLQGQIAGQQQAQQQSAQAFPVEQQQRQQQVQQQQLQLQDQQTLHQLSPQFVTRDENGKVNGYDWDGFYNKALENGVNPQTIMAARSQQLEFTQKLAGASKAQMDAENDRYKQLYEVFEGVKGVKDPQQRQQAYLQALPRIARMGVDVRQFPTQVPDDATIESMEAPFGQHAQMLADAKTQAETKKANLGTPDLMEMQSYLTSPKVPNESLPVSQRTPASFVAWKAKQSPLAQINVAQGAGGGMNQDAIDQAAEYYHLTGKLPPGGRGVAGLAQNRQIMNRASELFPGSMAQGTAEYAANKTSLGNLQKQFDQVSAFENTAGKNLDLFLTQANKVIDSGSPWINTPLRNVNQKVLGDADQAAFNAARQTALTEISKVLNSSTGTGVLTNEARSEVENLIGPNASLKQIVSAANILKQDMANRHQAYQDQISDIQGRMSGKGGQGQNKQMIRARDPQGVLHEAPVGTPLPQGWKAE